MTNKGRTLGEAKSAFNPDQEVTHLRAQVAALDNALKAEKKLTGEARLATIELAESIERAKPSRMVYHAKATSKAPVTYVVQLTDLHNGEVTERDEVDGFNEFNPQIFTARLEDLAAKILDHVRVQRAGGLGYHIPRLHILGTGDYISGDIHEELKVTNAYPTPVQAVRAGYDIGAFVATLAPYFEKVTGDFITLDNHGRMTRKNQAAEGGENNWGYVVAHIIQQHCARLPNVRINIHAKASALVAIGPEKYLLFHGHQIKGWAGLPYYGFDRRVAMEAIKRMGIPESVFTKMVMGHFHVAVDSPQWIIGGSLSGTNPFDHACGRHSQAHQTSWLVHEKHGQFGFTRWWL